MQPITLIGLAVCFLVLYLRAREARKRPGRSLKQRFKTAHVLIGALLVWLVVGMNLRHVSIGLNGESHVEPSAWERFVRMLSAWWT